MKGLRLKYTLIILYWLNAALLCAQTNAYMGQWKLVDIRTVQSAYLKNVSDTAYKGLNITEITSSFISVKQVDEKTTNYPYHIKTDTFSSHLIVKKLKVSLSVQYSDADSLVLTHYYTDASSRIYAYYNHYKRSDEHFKSFSTMKKQLLHTKWNFCGEWDHFPKDSIRMTNIVLTEDSCRASNCTVHWYVFTAENERLELRTGVFSGCEGGHLATISHESLILNPDLTVTIGQKNHWQSFRPVFISSTEMMLVKVKQE